MAMTTCKECEEEVSSKAKTCPNCGVNNPGGRNTRTKKSGGGIGLFIATILVVYGIFMFIGDNTPTTDSSSSAKTETKKKKSDSPPSRKTEHSKKTAAQNIIKTYRKENHSDDAQTIDEALFHGQARALVIR